MDTSVNKNLGVVKDWVEAVNTHDIDRICSILHPGYEYDLEYSSIKGVEAAREGWKLYLAGFTDFHYDVVLMIGSEDYVVSRLRMKGIHTGPFRFVGTDSLEDPIPPKNNPIDVPTCAIHKIQDGKIIRMWSYWDTATLLKQMRK